MGKGEWRLLGGETKGVYFGIEITKACGSWYEIKIN